jgi:hypothetical protein
MPVKIVGAKGQQRVRKAGLLASNAARSRFAAGAKK